MSWETVLGYLSGLYWVNPHLDATTLLRTVCLVHTCDAVICRLMAHNNGRSKAWWTLSGLVLGIWAVAVLILLPDRRRSPQ